MITIKDLILEENIRLVDSGEATNDEAQYFADGAKWAVRKLIELAEKHTFLIGDNTKPIVLIDKLKELAEVE